MRELTSVKNGAESLETEARQGNGHALPVAASVPPATPATATAIVTRSAREIDDRLARLTIRWRFASEDSLEEIRLVAQAAAIFWVLDPDVTWADAVDRVLPVMMEIIREEGL